jgi:hypothetical protein
MLARFGNFDCKEEGSSGDQKPPGSHRTSIDHVYLELGQHSRHGLSCNIILVVYKGQNNHTWVCRPEIWTESTSEHKLDLGKKV